MKKYRLPSPYRLAIICAVLFASLLISKSIPWVDRELPIISIDEREVTYAMAYQLSDNFDALPIDSVKINTSQQANEILNWLVRGQLYATVEDVRSGKLPGGPYSAVLCHDPHFTLNFFDSDAELVYSFSICQKCSNVLVGRYLYGTYCQLLEMEPGAGKAFADLEAELFAGK
jgi:hypothetical protein